MNTLQQIVSKQTWIDQATSTIASRAALDIISKQLPQHIRQELKQTAKEQSVDYRGLLCCNLSCELAIIALSCDNAPSLPSVLWSLGHKSRKATPVGCTSVGIVHPSGAVEMYRNLDWADPDGLLKENTQLSNFPATSKHYGFSSLTFPGFSGVLTGKSSNGAYAVAINAVCINAEPQFGKAPTMLLREVLETCETYEQAKVMLSETVLMCSIIYTLVGANGEMVTIERSANKYAHRHPVPLDDGRKILISTNDFMVMSPDGHSSLGELTETSDERYKNVLSDANQGIDMRAVMLKADLGCTLHTAHIDLTHNQLTWW